MRIARHPVLIALPLLVSCAATTAQQPAPAPAAAPAAKAEAAAPTGAPAADAPVWSSAERLNAFCDAQIAKVKQDRDALTATGHAVTVDGVLVPYDRALGAIDRGEGWASLLFNVAPDAAVRDAGQKCVERLEKVANDLSLDRAVYDAVAAVDVSKADATTRRLSEKVLEDFRRAGVDKDEATRTRLAAIYEKLVGLEQTFEKNVTEDVRHITVDGPEALKGLPADWIASHAPGADGKITITTDYPDFFPFETYAERGDLRKALYLQYLSRGYPQNDEVLKQVLALRHEYAVLLGYSDWADYMARDKMVRDAKTIETFLGRVAGIARPRMESDLKTLLAAKREADPKATRIDVWDRFYWTSKVREARYGYDAKTVRPYFAYPKVKQGVLDLYSKLFGVTFVRLEGAPVWDPSVEAYSVRQGEKEIGRFFLDMHPREGKYKHAATYSIQTAEKGRIAMGSLVCNFPDPSRGDALMEHDDVQTFFHEFGHLIHFILGQSSPYDRLNGFNVEWDFVEVPSQLLEEWTWSPEILGAFATNAKGEPIPAELVKRMKEANDFGKGINTMRQIFYAASSFELHRLDPETLDLEKTTDALYAKYSPFPRPAGSHVFDSFGHLMNYTSMYYTYQWSLAIAKDLFSRFEAEGLMNPAVDAAYKNDILVPGGTRDADDMVKTFLGRPRSLDAYRKWLEN